MHTTIGDDNLSHSIRLRMHNTVAAAGQGDLCLVREPIGAHERMIVERKQDMHRSLSHTEALMLAISKRLDGKMTGLGTPWCEVSMLTLNRPVAWGTRYISPCIA
jgi:hypothetical protein